MRRNLLWTSVGFLLALSAIVCAQNLTLLTNTVYNAESTGNVLTLPFKLDVQTANCADSGPWSNWDLGTPGMANGAPAFQCIAGTSNGPMAELDYDNTPLTPEYAYNRFRLPSDWTGTVDLALVWKTPATTGNVKWQVQTACVATGGSLDPSWNTAQSVTTAAQGTTLRAQTSTITGITTTGCSAGSLFKYRIFRDAGDAADTIADYVGLVTVEWTYRRAI